MVVFKEHIFNSVYFWVEGVVVLKELIFKQLPFGRVWWSSKTCFVTVFTYGEGVVVLKELISNSLYFRVEGVVVMKELIFKQFLLGGGCGGIPRM